MKNMGPNSDKHKPFPPPPFIGKKQGSQGLGEQEIEPQCIICENKDVCFPMTFGNGPALHLTLLHMKLHSQNMLPMHAGCLFITSTGCPWMDCALA